MMPHRPKVIALKTLLVLIITQSALAADASDIGTPLYKGPVPLQLGVTLRSQIAKIDEEIIRYRPEGLEPNKHYEVRVSFPSTNPVEIHLWLETRPETSHRKLLHAEKVAWHTDGSALSLQGTHNYGQVDVLFQAKRWALSRYGPDGGHTNMIYDIVLEENYHGIPHSSMPLLMFGVCMIVCLGLFVPTWTKTIVPRLLNWLSTGETSKERTI